MQILLPLVASIIVQGASQVGDAGSIPGSEDSLGTGNPLQYSCWENPMDREPGGLQFVGSQRVGPD